MKNRVGFTSALCCGALIAVAVAAQADDALLRPYVLASEAPGSVSEVADAARRSLQQAGFEIAGEYAPSEGAQVIVATSDALRAAAARTPAGGFGAAVRVSATKAGENVQVAYTNPAWMANVYRLPSEPEGVAGALEKALGRKEEFGSKAGLSAKALRSYHYMMLMPYFDEPVVLGAFASQAEAVARVEAGLDAAKGVKKVFRIDLPGGEQTLFGVAILSGKGADAEVMRVTDTGARRHTAHLPYEMLVAGGRVLMLHGKFRIAQSFPDLSMGTFMKISGAPDGIEQALRATLR